MSSRRREAIEHHYDREQARLDQQLGLGSISRDEYNAEALELERSANEEAREARLQDLDDVHDDWRF